MSPLLFTEGSACRETHNGIPKGQMSLWSGVQRAESPLVALRRARNSFRFKSSARVNPRKRSGGSFFGEGRPAIEGVPKRIAEQFAVLQRYPLRGYDSEWWKLPLFTKGGLPPSPYLPEKERKKGDFAACAMVCFANRGRRGLCPSTKTFDLTLNKFLDSLKHPMISQS